MSSRRLIQRVIARPRRRLRQSRKGVSLDCFATARNDVFCHRPRADCRGGGVPLLQQVATLAPGRSRYYPMGGNDRSAS